MPHYRAAVTTTPPMSPQPTISSASRDGEPRAWLFPAVGVALAIALLLAAYLLLRFASVEAAALAVTGLLIALAVAGFVSAGRGHAATFVAIALVLPYVLGAVVAYASAQRVSDEISDIFSDVTDEEVPDTSFEEESPSEDFTAPDDNQDGYADDFYEGTDCTTVSSTETEFQECMANGGFDPMDPSQEVD